MRFKILVLPLLFLVAAVLTPLAPVLGHPLPQPARHASRAAYPARARYLVLFVLDGARPDYFGLTRLPHVDALRKNGVQYSNAMDGILESETPAGHTALATGSTPRRDGILGFKWGQGDNDVNLFSPAVIRSGAMEHIMENVHVPTIAGLYKHRYPRGKVVALSGHKYYAADPLGGPHADAIMYYQGDAKGRYVPVSIPGHTPPAAVFRTPGLIRNSTHLPLGVDDSLANALALATFKVMHQQITLINEPEFDWPVGHVDGGIRNKRDVITLMKVFDRDLGAIEAAYRKAGILNQTLFVITADHGMAQVKRYIPGRILDKALKTAGARATAIASNHGNYVWLRDGSKAMAVARGIARAKDPGVQAVYYLTGRGSKRRYMRAPGTTESPELEAANQYLLATLMNGHEPNIVALSRADATWSDASNHWRADHGGTTWQSQHIPLIISGPGIRSGLRYTRTAQLDDIAPTVLADLGVEPSGMEGRVLTEALRRPPAGLARARARETAQVGPVVAALKAQGHWEYTHPIGTVR